MCKRRRENGPREQPDRIHITLAHRLGLGELVDRHVNLGDAPGRANAGDKVLTLVASALACGDCIDDDDALRAGETQRVRAA